MSTPDVQYGVYRTVLGASFDELSPRLRAYFSPIPPGSVGRGVGIFERVGTRLIWLRPVIGLLFDRSHVLMRNWATDAPFTVVNTPITTAGRVPAIRARRDVTRLRGVWTMIDEISVGPGGAGIRDLIGSPPRLDVLLEARVTGGALRMRSRSATLLLGRLRLSVPHFLAPTVELTEQWDETAQLQRISVAVRVPLLGTVYEYAGRFSYAIEGGEELA